MARLGLKPMVPVGICYSCHPASLLFTFQTLRTAYVRRRKASVGSPISLLVEKFGTVSPGRMLILR